MSTPPNVLPELLPCPFCGGEASIDYQPFSIVVSCDDCGVARKTLCESGEEEAISEWNRRTHAPAVRDVVAAAKAAHDAQFPRSSFKDGEEYVRSLGRFAAAFTEGAKWAKEGDAVRELRECIRELLAANDMDGVSDAELLDAEERGFAPEIRQQAAAIRKARALLADGREMGGEGR